MKKWRVKLKRKPIPTIIHQRDGFALELIKARLKKLELRVPARPKNDDGTLLEPRLPRDLTALNDVRLGKLYGQYCKMAQWAQIHLAILGVEKAAARQAEKMVRAQTRLSQEGTVSDKDANVELDHEVQERTMKTQVGEGAEAITQAFLQNYIIGRDACSRELTRRLGMTPDAALRR